MKPSCSYCLFALFLGLASLPVGAQLLIINPATLSPRYGTVEGGSAGVGISDADYDVPEGTVELSRTYLYANTAIGLNETFDIAGGVSYHYQPELSGLDIDINNDDQGFGLALALRARPMHNEHSSLHGFAQLFYYEDTFTQEDEKLAVGLTDEEIASRDLTGRRSKASGYEMLLGGVYARRLGPVQLYGGAELVAYSDSTFAFDIIKTEEDEPLGSSRKSDFERSDPVSVRTGASWDIGEFILQAEAVFVGETGFRFGCFFPF